MDNEWDRKCNIIPLSASLECDLRMRHHLFRLSQMMLPRFAEIVFINYNLFGFCSLVRNSASSLIYAAFTGAKKHWWDRCTHGEYQDASYVVSQIGPWHCNLKWRPGSCFNRPWTWNNFFLLIQHFSSQLNTSFCRNA